MTIPIISFAVNGDWASFRDPSVTSNQTIYYIPSKTAIVGLLGAIIGIKRDNKLDTLYSDNYLDFFSKVSIGIKLENLPRKITYFTNHRSFEAAKTKPVKKEILEMPKYRIFVKSSQKILDELLNRITNNKFVFPPYLGHVYCLAKLGDLQKHTGKKIDDATEEITDCVVLDETNPDHNENSSTYLRPTSDSGTLVIERHLHHFLQNNSLKKLVLKHWIPLNSTECEIDELAENNISEFYKIGQKVYCLY